MILIDIENIGGTLRAMREMLGVPRRELARRIAVRSERAADTINAQIWTWEAGRRSPDLTSAAKAFEQLGYRLALVPIEEEES